MADPRIYNSRLIDTYLKLIKVKHPHVNVEAMIRSIGIEPYEVADEGLWFTQDQINRFYAAVVQATGNENIARDAGRFSASADTLGTVRQYILAMLGPSKAFALGSKLSGTLTKSADYETKILGPNSVELTVRPRPGVKEEAFQCQNRLGVFEAIVALFGYKPPVIEHRECLFNGASICRYVIRWQPNLTTRVKYARDLYSFGAVAGNLALAMTTPALLEQAIPLTVTGFLGMNWWLEASRKKLAENTLESLRDSADQLNEQINVNYRNTQIAREIGEAITSPNNLDEVLQVVVQTLESTLDFERGLVLLANRDTNRLEIRGAFGYTDEYLDLLESTSFSLTNPNSQGPLVVSFREQRPVLVNNVTEISDQVSPKSRQFIEALGTKSFLAVPIVLENQSVGILAVDNVTSKKTLANSDVNLLMSIAPTLGVSFRNAALIEARENQFAATLKVLAHSIDARDFLTAGHSEKVAEYAIGIAAELGLQHDYCQMIRIASLLHDYGKIGIPDTVLKKNGPLTEEERALIQTHSEKSFDILSQVPFDELNQEIPLVALHHHEFWDGSGYPKGLKGKDIPLGARIVAVADFFEAITAKRHYRDPMALGTALDLLKKGSGSHFDPEVVKAFLRYIKKIRPNLDLPAEKDQLIQRRDPRYKYQAPVKARVADMVIAGETTDISAGGIFLQIPQPHLAKISGDTSLELTIDLPNGRRINLTGEVRWVNKADAKNSLEHPAGLGVAFRNLDENIRDVLNYLLHRRARIKEFHFPLPGRPQSA